MIVGTRVDLRGLEADDLPLLVRWRNAADVRRSFFDKSLISVSAQARWYERYLSDPERQIFIAAAKEDGRPIGMIGLYRINHRDRNAEIGSTMIGDRSRRGEGLGGEMVRLLLDYAFVDLGLHRIYAYAIDTNQASVKVKLSCGFRREGLLREAHWADGAYRDVIVLGMTRSDWDAPRPAPGAG